LSRCSGGPSEKSCLWRPRSCSWLGSYLRLGLTGGDEQAFSAHATRWGVISASIRLFQNYAVQGAGRRAKQPL
jgi:hypothetical protein